MNNVTPLLAYRAHLICDLSQIWVTNEFRMKLYDKGRSEKETKQAKTWRNGFVFIHWVKQSGTFPPPLVCVVTNNHLIKVKLGAAGALQYE